MTSSPVAVLDAAKALCTSLAGLFVVLGITVNPLLWVAIPPVIAALYGLYVATQGKVTVALNTPVPTNDDLLSATSAPLGASL
ncbi:hypothetical protein acdb102_31320 [Acidothermaceae bacterium B102]|nr:hypothetical protein acdb102_31320 [Acidothermaceae bacterium B102]